MKKVRVLEMKLFFEENFEEDFEESFFKVFEGLSMDGVEWIKDHYFIRDATEPEGFMFCDYKRQEEKDKEEEENGL
jgi:hypothetical protein